MRRALLAAFVAIVACSSSEPIRSQSAGTIAGDPIDYETFDEHQQELVISTGQPFAKFSGVIGYQKRLEIYVVGEQPDGTAPNTLQPIAYGLVRPGKDEPWYCATKGVFQLPPANAPGRAQVTVSGLSRLPVCTTNREISFPIPLSRIVRASGPVETQNDYLRGAVVTGYPSDLAWTFRSSYGDFYFALRGEKNDPTGGAIVFLPSVPSLALFQGKGGVACVGHTNVKELDLDAGGTRPVLHAEEVSEFRMCPGTPVPGELTLKTD